MVNVVCEIPNADAMIAGQLMIASKGNQAVYLGGSVGTISTVKGGHNKELSVTVVVKDPEPSEMREILNATRDGAPLELAAAQGSLVLGQGMDGFQEAPQAVGAAAGAETDPAA